MRCKRPARWSEDHAFSTRRDVLNTMGLGGAAFAAAPESPFPATWFREGEEVVPFTDVPADFSTRPGEFAFRLDLDVTLTGRERDGEMQWFERSVTRQRAKSVIARVTRAPEGRFRIFGVAWTDGAGLASVEVRVDSGEWRAAQLDFRSTPRAWTFFTLETGPLAPGEHTLVSRATDTEGRSQPENLDRKSAFREHDAPFWRTIAVP